MYWPLMQNAVTFEDRLKLIEFISSTDRFTCGKKVEEFEKAWSEWLGVKHSLMVTSGSTANLLLVAAVKEFYNIPDGANVLVPACTWVTNISPVIQLNLNPVFCDINLNDYSFNLDDLPDVDISIVFVTHLLGLSAPMEALRAKYPTALFLEDICESHGVMGPDGKRGTDSVGSTFSFYYGHHMTTIEGGMISCNDRDLYELMKIKRSHGLARVHSPEYYQKAIEKYPDINPQFLFLTDGYNFRPTELNAVLGLEQLKRLNRQIDIRKENYKCFVETLSNDKFIVPKYTDTNSSFCFPIVCKNDDDVDRIKKIMDEHGVEHRPIVSGNLLIHPFLSKYKKSVPNAEYINKNGIYIGNNHMVTVDMIRNIIEIINK